MEVEEIQAQACGNSKFQRLGNGRINDPKLAQHKDHLLLHHCNPDNDDNDDDNDNHTHRVGPEIKRPGNALVSVSAAIDATTNNGGGGGNRLRGWHNSSRIIRVSRASGGKDRHSKVWTSKGLRDRRVRLSVTTAIQFYDLQDRLGYDQPSKAVEWLINAAAEAIAELPSLNTASFPDTPKQLSDEKRAATAEQGFDSADVELELEHGDAVFHQQHLSLSKSACSSTSETSKGSGLSLSRSEIRVKARERARERAAKEKERENPSCSNAMNNINSISQNSSFTALLTSGINNVSSNHNNNNTSSSPTTASEHQSFFHKPSPATAAMAQMDYFSTGILGLSSSTSSSLRAHQHHSPSSSGFPGQIHLGNSLPMSIPSPFGISIISGGDAEALQAPPPHFSFVPEQHLIPVAAAAAPSQTGNGGGGDYSRNFSITSSGLAGFNRGTLQSNSSQSSLLPHQHLQRFSSPIDGSNNVPFFFGAAAAPPMENHHHHHHHHQFPAGFDGRLQLCYGDGSRHSDQKGKGKN